MTLHDPDQITEWPMTCFSDIGKRQDEMPSWDNWTAVFGTSRKNLG